jgi:hypothetical protein
LAGVLLALAGVLLALAAVLLALAGVELVGAEMNPYSAVDGKIAVEARPRDGLSLNTADVCANMLVL